MELIKKNIHMDHIRARAVSQISLEDDVNIPESKGDVDALIQEKGDVIIEEIRPGTDMVHIRGRLVFCVLYHTRERGGCLVPLEGRIPFDEKINLQGVTAQDIVSARSNLEDLHVSTINSRKLSVQSVLTLHVQAEEIRDVEVPIGLCGEENVEYRRIPLELARLTVSNNDVFRVKEELSLPSGYPNIYCILWNTVSLRDLSFKAQTEKISLEGEIQVFVLYEGEGEDHPVRSFEKILPLQGVLECHGCREGMFPDVRYTVSQQELAVRPDFDGEERCFGLELALDVAVRVYEEESLEVLSDLYGVNREVETVTQKANLQNLLAQVTGKTKVTGPVRADGGAPILQLLHSEGSVSLDHKKVVENGIRLQGGLHIRVMYITGNDGNPYVSMQVQLPYEYTLDVPGIRPEDLGAVRGEVEQLQVNMLDSEELDVKAVLSFTTTVFRNLPMQLICQVKLSDIDSVKLGNLPSMVIYMTQPGDNLWNIGKKYYVPVNALRELNGLGSDELQEGQKLLIVKGS